MCQGCAVIVLWFTMYFMSDNKKENKKTGPPSFEEMYGEKFTSLRFNLPESLHEKLRERAILARVSMAEYMRRLIATDVEKPKPNPDE